MGLISSVRKAVILLRPALMVIIVLNSHLEVALVHPVKRPW
jgi:hypothetical protein